MRENNLLTFIIFIIFSFLLSSCSKSPKEVELKHAPTTPPAWVKDAVWYQIFVERFYNGDPSNDPSVSSIEGSYPGFMPDTWATTPWTQDWYKEDDYFKDVHNRLDPSGKPIIAFDTKVSLRRYGGDLQGVIDKLDYIASLGVNAIYFNPINDSPSSHKYDARHWRHVDVNFGPDPQGDLELIDNEDPEDPSTWVFTSADTLFLKLLQKAKSKGIRVILDYSWKYTSHAHWAWKDVLENQQQSEFTDWYWVDNFDDPTSPENEFSYKGWSSVFQFPQIQDTHANIPSQQTKFYEGNIKSERAKAHIFSVTRRWLDPDGDGDPSDGVDGYRLNVVAELPLGFWKEYRTYVKSINPDAYLVGEIKWEKWPDKLLDPSPVLQGDIFDAVMNYRWFQAARKYFMDSSKASTSTEFVESLVAQKTNIEHDFNLSMMNVSANHDSPRLVTSLDNINTFQFNAKPSKNSRYLANKPSKKALHSARLLLAHQFTYLGSPQIWAGDEMGMWGSDAPHNRKPLIWPEYNFENETSHPNAIYKAKDSVEFNQELFHYYQFLINLRIEHSVLSSGQIEFTDQNDGRKIMGYRRYFDNENNPSAKNTELNLKQQAWVMFNTGKYEHTVLSPEPLLGSNYWMVWNSNSNLSLLKTAPSEQVLLPANTVTIIFSY